MECVRRADSFSSSAFHDVIHGLAGIEDFESLKHVQLAVLSLSQAVNVVRKVLDEAPRSQDGKLAELKDLDQEKKVSRATSLVTDFLEFIWKSTLSANPFTCGAYLREIWTETESGAYTNTYSLILEYRGFPFKDESVDEWFSIEIARANNVEGGNEDSVSKVKAFNSSDKNFDTLTEAENKQFGNEDRTGYWYHGTNHQSAKRILEDGIQFRKNKLSQDFSNKDGFYVSPKFSCAKGWSGRKSSEGPAVIIFNVGEELEKFRGLDLSGDKEDDWKKVVKFNRCGTKNPFAPLTGDLKEDFKNADYVIGPRSGGKRVMCTKECETWQPQGYSANKIQLCVKTEQLAEVFSSIGGVGIEGVIFYRKGVTEPTPRVAKGNTNTV